MPLHRRFCASAAAACLIATLGACTRKSDTENTAPHQEAGPRVTYTDMIGRQVRLTAHPERIISLAPSITEIIFLLGIEDRLIGVTNQCDWPEAVTKKARIGDLLNPNYETIVAAKPDLVIASTAGNDRAAVLKLSDLGLPVYVTAPRSVQGIFQTVESVARIVDAPRQGDRLLADMKQRLDRIHQTVAGSPGLKAFFITWFDPLLAPGENTFENDVLRQAGIESITAQIHEFYPRFSLEQLLAQDPDIIITVERSNNPLPDLHRLSGWQRLRAVRNGRVYVINEAFQHPSPRFVDGLEQLVRELHPERLQ